MPALRRRPRHLGVDIIPLVDVLVNLLFFFLVTIQAKAPVGHNHSITVPEVKSKGPQAQAKQIEIGLTKDGKIFYNGSAVSEAQLTELLKAAAALDKTQSILLIADEGSLTGAFYRLMDECRRVGLDRIRLQTR